MYRKNTPGAAPKPGSRANATKLALIAALILALVVLGLALRPQPETTPAPAREPAAVENRAAVFMPGEFEPQETLLIGGSQLVELFPQVLADVVQAVSGEIDVHILTGTATAHARVDSIVKTTSTRAKILDLPIYSMRVRDFGPLTVSDAQGRRHLVDFHYRERRGNQIDDDVPRHLAPALGHPLKSSQLLVEGGDLLSNGRGFCLLSTRVINRNAHYLVLDPTETVNSLAGLLGFEELHLAIPLEGESTGHVDMFAAFLATDLLIVGQYAAEIDAQNMARLDALAATLSGQATLDGPLRVERIPMPDHNDGVWRSYTNIVFANGVLLVPVYPDYCPDLDRIALATYKRLLPGLRVVGVDASKLIHMNGALRCITMNVPRGMAVGSIAPAK